MYDIMKTENINNYNIPFQNNYLKNNSIFVKKINQKDKFPKNHEIINVGLSKNKLLEVKNQHILVEGKSNFAFKKYYKKIYKFSHRFKRREAFKTARKS